MAYADVRITFVFFNEMLSILVHVICLGVLQNGAKYHFHVRQTTGDMSKVPPLRASGGLREMP